MTRIHSFGAALAPMALAAGVLMTPILAGAQTDGKPGDPPGTVVGRTIDRMTGTPTTPDGTAGNPAGTALDRGTARVAAAAQGAVAAVTLTMTPGTVLAERPRLSQILGGDVYNERNEKIGEVEDIVLMPPQVALGAAPVGPVAILQVGGFLGMGGRLGAVPVGDLRWSKELQRITVAGATKETLQARPTFEYAAPARG